MSIEEFSEQVHDKREYTRGQAVKLDLAGYGRKATAAALSVSVNFVSKWRLQYNRQPYIGRETLESYLECEYGVRYKSTSSYYELLHQAGISYKKRQSIPRRMSKGVSLWSF